MQYIGKQACFAVTTPYQIIGAISIVLKEKMNADLYIFGMFDGYENVANAIKKEGIFDSVICVEPEQFQFTKKSKALRQIVTYRRVTATFLPETVKYDVFYTTSRAHVKTLMIHELKRRNREMSFVIYEDGIGMYRPGKLAIVTSQRRRLFERLIGWRMFEPERTSIIAYEPKLVDASRDVTIKPIGNMPRIDWNTMEGDLIRRIFAMDNKKTIAERIIVFDNIRHGNVGNDEAMDRAIGTILSITTPSDVICKPHPRSISVTKTGMKVYSYSGIPIEAIYSYMNDLENRILISCTSTASMTPKLLFDKEPYIIDISEMINGSMGTENEAMLNKIEKMYRRKERVIRIRSLDELQLEVKRLYNN